jgi:hypothetical protein
MFISHSTSAASAPRPLAKPLAAKSAASDGYSGSVSQGSMRLGAALLALCCAVPQVAQADTAATTQDPDISALFEKTQTKVGDYTLDFRPVDVDLSPRFKGIKPGLRARGDFLQAELSKREPVNEDWSRVQGLRGRLHGNINTFGDASAELNVEAFRRWEGSWGRTMSAMVEVSSGVYRDLHEGTTSTGVQLRQELKGGRFEFAGQPLSWNIQGRQSYRHVMDGDSANSGLSYEVLLGARRDFQVNLFGKEGTLSAVVGPQLRGGPTESAKVSPKVQLRLKMASF